MTEHSTALAKASENAGAFALANCIRTLSIDGVEAANSGHPGAPMGMAEAPIPIGRTGTALSCPTGTAPCCFTPCCI